MLKDLKKNMQLTLLNSDDLLHLSCLLETDPNEERKAVLQNKLFSILTAKTVGLEFEVDVLGVNMGGFATSGEESYLVVPRIIIVDGRIRVYVDEHRYIGIDSSEKMSGEISSMGILVSVVVSEKNTKPINLTVYADELIDDAFLELSEKDLADNNITVTT